MAYESSYLVVYYNPKKAYQGYTILFRTYRYGPEYSGISEKRLENDKFECLVPKI